MNWFQKSLRLFIVCIRFAAKLFPNNRGAYQKRFGSPDLIFAEVLAIVLNFLQRQFNIRCKVFVVAEPTKSWFYTHILMHIIVFDVYNLNTDLKVIT